jgi:hypothetical protein
MAVSLALVARSLLTFVFVLAGLQKVVNVLDHEYMVENFEKYAKVSDLAPIVVFSMKESLCVFAL